MITFLSSYSLKNNIGCLSGSYALAQHGVLQLKHGLLCSATGYLGEFSELRYPVGQISASITVVEVVCFLFFLLCQMMLLPNRKTFKHTNLLSGITNWSSNVQCWKQAEKKFLQLCCSTSWVKMAEVKCEGYWHGARCYIPHLSNEC